MKKILLASLILGTAFLSGCASAPPTGTSSPVIVDMAGVDPAAYNRDLSECTSLAQQKSVGTDAAVGAAAGALIGGGYGAAWGWDGSSRKSGAGWGAGAGVVEGAVTGGMSGYEERKQIIGNCLRYRGYKVLN